tara:strand:+ start:36 stop:680 length:645 start_codon:yes stop_codon:yes gene_type:complete
MSSNTFGYIADTGPEQAFRSNTGVFDPADINELLAENKWTNFGQLELIQTQTASGVSSVNFTNIQGNVYDVHFITCNDIDSSTDNEELQVRFSNDGGSSYESSNYQHARQYGNASGSFGEVRSTSVDAIDISNAIGNASNEKGNAYCYLYNLNDSTKYSFVTFHSSVQNNSNVQTMAFGMAVYTQTETIDAIQVLLDNSSNISGTLSLYGIRFS